MDERGRRIGLNEVLFREVNERVKAINDEFNTPLTEAEFVCECGDDSCTQRIRMTMTAYEELRAEPTHFAVAAGHETQAVERIVARREGYDVVAKLRGEPARIAAETDPRD